MNEAISKSRIDGKGDGWANSRRTSLPSKFACTDIDIEIGAMAYRISTEDRTFYEFVPDAYANRDKLIRYFGLVAIFDRKNARATINDKCTRATAFQLDLCRTYRDRQGGIAPRFFYVIGKSNDPKWEMVEVNIDTGEMSQDSAWINSGMSWLDQWASLGLTFTRSRLEAFLLQGSTAVV